MKFTHGYWRTRTDLKVMLPQQIRDVVTSEDSLTVLAPTLRRPGERSSTLHNPLVTIACTAPAPDVISVRITHHAGQRPRRPDFALAGRDDVDAQVEVDDHTASLTSGALSVRFDLGERFGMEFLAGGSVLTRSGRRGIAVVTTGDGQRHIHEGLVLTRNEAVYGLGERFGPLVRNGQTIDIWNEDGGTDTELAYKNIPFYLTNRGYGVFVNHPGRVVFEVGSEVPSQVRFSVRGESLEYLIIYGPTMDEVLQRYTALTGRAALPPAWSFGLWLSTSFITPYDQQAVAELVEGMARRDLPLSVFHFDCFWMRGFRWCDFEWDPRSFPRPQEMLAELHERGVRSCVWIGPHITQQSALFAEAEANDYLLRRPDGDVWQTDEWQSGMALVDFTNPQARSWFAEKLRGVLDTGVDTIKTDLGEDVPTDVVWSDGSDPERMHNYYSYLYNMTVFDALRKHRGDGDAVLFARAATVGSQRFPVHWAGDSEATFEGMAQSLRAGLSAAISGFGFWSQDIGGFEGTPDPALFKRWLAFGLLCTHSRLHGSYTYRVPWLFDDESVDVLRTFTRLKHRLMPYLYAAAVRACREGVPVMRPMVASFPDDPACSHLDGQYLLGDRLLVAPIFTADGEASYYVPTGVWTDLLTGDRITGPRWHREYCDFHRIPLLVAPDSAVPMADRYDRPDYRYADGVVLRLYELAERSRLRVIVPRPEGADDATFHIERDGDVVRVVRDGDRLPWRVLLVAQHGARVHGGSVHDAREGTAVSVAPDVGECRIVLPS